MSTPGITWDGSARTTLAPASCAMTATEWIGHTTATLSSVTTTITLSSTPIGASAQIAAFSGSEDPSGTFNPSDKAAGFASTNSQCSGPSSAPTGTSVTTLNANDMVVGFVVSSTAYTATAGTGYTLLGTATSATCGTGPGCSLGMEDQSATATAAFNCAFTAQVNRWIVICDALQSAPKYFKVEPETSASLTGTPSTAANGFSGTGWVYNVAGIQNGLFDIQSGTWQIDLTGAVGSTTGNPFARYFITAWSCTTNSCTTATLLWKNWDTATNVASSTTATPRTYTTPSQSQITWTSGNFLAFEVWVAWQYSGTTTTTTMTETTISTAMDFITPGWDNAQSLSGSLTPASAFVKMTSMFKSLSGSLSSVSSFAEKTSIFKALAASITLTMGNMVVNVNSGQLTCNSGPRSCSTSLTATWNLGSGVAGRSSLFRFLSGSLSRTASETKGITKALSGSLSLTSVFAKRSSLFRSLVSSLAAASGVAKQSSLFRSLTGSLSSASGFTERTSLFRSLSASVSIASGFTEKSSLFRSLTGALSSASGLAEKSTLFRSLTGALSSASGLAEKSTLFRSLTGTLGFAASETKGLAKVLTGALVWASGFVEKSSLVRSLTGSLSLAGSLFAGRAVTLTGSLGSASSLAERSSLVRSLTGSLSLDGSQIKGLARALSDSMSSASSFAERSSLFRSLGGSLSSASNFAERSSLFRSLSGSLGLAASQVKGLAKALTGSLSLASGLAEWCSLFRSLSG